MAHPEGAPEAFMGSTRRVCRAEWQDERHKWLVADQTRVGGNVYGIQAGLCGRTE